MRNSGINTSASDLERANAIPNKAETEMAEMKKLQPHSKSWVGQGRRLQPHNTEILTFLVCLLTKHFSEISPFVFCSVIN